MASLKQLFKDEFSKNRFLFSKCKPAQMVKSGCWCSCLPLLVYRLGALIFTATILALVLNRVKTRPYERLAAFTVWGYIFVIAYFLTATIISIVYTVRNWESEKLNINKANEQTVELPEYSSSNGNVEGDRVSSVDSNSPSLPWYMVIQWILYNISFSNALLVTIVYWSVLYPRRENFTTGILDIGIHAMNSVLMIGEQYMNSIPSRILHVYHSMLFGIAYLIFTIIFWSQTGIVIYKYILDMDRPGPTSASLVGIMVYYIITQVTLFLVYTLKERHCCKRNNYLN